MSFVDVFKDIVGTAWDVVTWPAEKVAVYRPRLVRHRVAAYAASAAVESRSRRTALGGLNPCRSISQVAL